jgi:RNA polymerase sigma-70 factor, ECF subfamily
VTATASLLSQVAAGDARAARACIERYGPLVWSLARRYAPQEAEDAVQDIFVSLWKSAGRFDATRGTEAGFVAMVARRRLIDLVRARARHNVVDPSAGDGAEVAAATDVAAEVEASVMGRAMAVRMQTALQALRPEQRQVLLLSTVQGLSQDEISKHTGMPLGTVKAHARRGLLKLRALIQGPSDDVARTPLPAPIVPPREEVER